MKKIFRIFRYDLKNISKSIIVFVVIVGISILPALYSWFNIVANWDPYSNTGSIPFAVCSLDKGFSYKGIEINAGDKIIENLKANPKMGWDFVSEKSARDGVKKGKYYAAVVIPRNFSKNLFSLTTGDFKQAKIEYLSNEKMNAIAPKITDKGAEAIENAVKSSYVDKLTEVIAAAMNVTGNEITESKESFTNRVSDSLNNAKDDIDEFRNLNDLFINTLDSVDSVLKTNVSLEKPVNDILSKAGMVHSDVTNTVNSLRDSSNHISDSVDDFMDLSKSYADEMDDDLTDAFDDLKEDSDTASTKLSKLKSINQKIVDVNTISLNIINSISKAYPKLKLDKIKNRLKDSNKKQNDIMAKIDEACESIEKNGSLPKDIKDELKKYVKESKTELSEVKTEFNNIKSTIKDASKNSYSALEDISELMITLDSGTTGLKEVTSSGRQTIKSLKKTFKGIQVILDNTDKKLDKLLKRVKDAKESDTLESIILPIIANPKSLGNFISSPVTTDKERLYKIENYGSAMTPFYTSLGLWVGGVVLVAVVAVTLSKREREELGKPREHQIYFGRYLIFLILGQIQALIISLGDLFFLKIQCEKPALFILASMLSSLVYTFLIYSLTITFSVLGKALSVIILVIQVAGSGGTFPIEVLPYAFQKIYTYLPFHYGINAMREAIAGPDMGAYWMNIGKLLAFMIFSLFVGIVLRKPCISVIKFFNERIEESDLIV